MDKNVKYNDLVSDSDLLKQYKSSGNLEILGELYTKSIHLVYGVCLKYLNDRDESKDAVNKIFEKLIVEIPKFEIQNFKSWLYVLTKNHCLMEIRRLKTEKKHFENFSNDYFMESTDISHPIDEDSDESIEDQLKKCIEKLKEEQKQCIEMFYYNSKCYKEISIKLEIEENKVKSYIQNGKRNLKICLEQHMQNENV
jgi:RNA polymerase sigma-70 factor (ECF subfamily)